jgi:hypothetical protein
MARLLLASLLSAAGLGTMVYLVVLLRYWTEGLNYNDFFTFWEAAHGWLAQGRSLYAPDTAHTVLGMRFTNLTLPHGHLLFLPVAWLPLPSAAATWLGIAAAALGVSLAIASRERGRAMSLGEGLWFAWSAPLHAQILTGQVAALLAIPAALAWRAVRRESWTQAGVWMGLLIGLKPFLVPLAAWLAWRRQWRGLATCALVVAVSGVVGVLVFGPAAYAQWTGTVREATWTQPPMNASWWGIATRVTSASPFTAPLIDAPGLGRAAGLAGVCVVVIGTWAACRRARSSELQWEAVLLAALVITPLGWIYYALLLLPVWLARGLPVVTAALWVVPVFVTFTVIDSPVGTATRGSLYAYGLLIWWVVATLEMWSRRRWRWFGARWHRP